MVDLAKVENLEFFGWDVYSDDCYKATKKAGVLDGSLIEEVKSELEMIKPGKAVFYKKFAENLNGKNIKKEKNYFKLANELINEIKTFKKEKNIDRLVMIWCGSTEIFLKKSSVHETIKSFEDGLKKNSKFISPSRYMLMLLSSAVPHTQMVPLTYLLTYPVSYTHLRAHETLR
mgnify:CR=1 FL=1